jgi:dTDP-4-amino-4,6-dideoxygalactose transaminase
MGEDELRLLQEAFESNWIAPLGPYVNEFEASVSRALDGIHAVALSSGTAALHLSLIMAGITAGDDVLVPTLTFSATANAVAYVGARPVFVDCDTESWQLDPSLVAEELTDRARAGRLPAAVITVDLYGQCADYDQLIDLCRQHDVPLIEDAAEALGATYRERPAGTFGEFGVLSFNGNKVITTSGGGMLLTHSAEAAEHARFLATQARDPAPHYEHSVIGFNYRMSNLLAAVGVGQMRVLDERVARRRDNNRFYRERLSGVPGIGFMPDAGYGEPSWWLTCLTIDEDVSGTNPTAVREELARHQIEARPLWKPLHLQPVFQGERVLGGKVSERLFRTGLCLPSGSSLTDNDRAEVADLVAGCVRSA